MQTVYAYIDKGLMSAVSRWKPRKILCTTQRDHSDNPGSEHVVKLAQGAAGAAAQISEVVCGGLLAAGGVPTLDRRLVQVSPSFAAAYVHAAHIALPVQPGLYFGSVLRLNVENGPPPTTEDVSNLQEVVDIWVMDSWFCNIDRELDGNILLCHDKNDRFSLIAADQSECFGGSGRLADGSWKKVLSEKASAPSVNYLQEVIFKAGGALAIRRGIDKVQTAAKEIERVFAEAPSEWWIKANDLSREELRAALQARSRRMETILNLKQWEDLDNATRGGHILF